MPVPVSKFSEAGGSECILPVLEKRGGITPCITAGRDMIGIAKIGLAYQIYVVCKGLTKFLGLKSTAEFERRLEAGHPYPMRPNGTPP